MIVTNVTTVYRRMNPCRIIKNVIIIMQIMHSLRSEILHFFELVAIFHASLHLLNKPQKS